MPKSQRKAAPTHPHDSIVKWTFSQREHAIGLLKAALPREMITAVDWSTLRVEKDSYVDAAFQSRYSDVVLSGKMGDEEIYFYSLIEHQRDVEPLMVFRMGLYMMRLWERLVLDRPTLKTLPPIVPLLVHHSETGWTAATAFQDIIAGRGPARAAIEQHIPHFELRLIDLSAGRASHLAVRALTALGQVVLWCLSVAGNDVRFEREIGRMAGALEEMLQAPNGLAALEVLLRYLAATHVRLRAEKVGKLLLKATGPRAQEVIVTFLDEIERKGERRGERKGERKGEIKGERRGRAKTLLELLAMRFGPVPAGASEQIMAADEAALTRWTARVLTASTLSGVMDDSAAQAPKAPLPAARKRARRA